MGAGAGAGATSAGGEGSVIKVGLQVDAWRYLDAIHCVADLGIADEDARHDVHHLENPSMGKYFIIIKGFSGKKLSRTHLTVCDIILGVRRCRQTYFWVLFSVYFGYFVFYILFACTKVPYQSPRVLFNSNPTLADLLMYLFASFYARHVGQLAGTDSTD